jgi:hypothetical protein
MHNMMKQYSYVNIVIRCKNEGKIPQHFEHCRGIIQDCLYLSFCNSDFSILTHFEHCRGIRKMKENLPSKTLKEKLPEFLRKCTQTFELDRRYRNDLRYLRVWLHLVTDSESPLLILFFFCINGFW